MNLKRRGSSLPLVVLEMIRVHRNSFLESATGGASKGSHICILLNSEATQKEVSALVRIWDVFDAVICADGGANRLYDGLMTMGGENCARYIPSHLIGDLDSVRVDVETFYRNGKCCVIKDADQDVNDLEKGLKLASELIGSGIRLNKSQGDGGSVEDKEGETTTTAQTTKIVVFGAFGGRFDQQIATLHTMYKYSSTFQSMVLLGEGNCATLLVPQQGKPWSHHPPSPSPSPSSSLPEPEPEPEPDTHSIQLIPGVEGPGCSLLPVGSRCRVVSTTGLQWDLYAQPLALGELVSTSNRVRARAGVREAEAEAVEAEEGPSVDTFGGDGDGGAGLGVTVRTSDPLLWCCEIDLEMAGR